MEAEAQCAYLCAKGTVSAVITDDSDVCSVVLCCVICIVFSGESLFGLGQSVKLRFTSQPGSPDCQGFTLRFSGDNYFSPAICVLAE